MKKLISWGALLMLPALAFADSIPIVQMQLNPAISLNKYSLGGVYTSPYLLNVTQLPSGTSTTILALACDDFTTDITTSTVWDAEAYTLKDVGNSGPQKFTGPLNVYDAGEETTTPPNPTDASYQTNISASAAYAAAGYLVYHLLFDPSVYGVASTSEDYSYAIWEIFDPTAWEGYLANNPITSDISAVNADIAKAFSNSIPKGYTLQIYTPCGLSTDGGCTSPPSTGVSQEFLGIVPTVPEASESRLWPSTC